MLVISLPIHLICGEEHYPLMIHHHYYYSIFFNCFEFPSFDTLPAVLSFKNSGLCRWCIGSAWWYKWFSFLDQLVQAYAYASEAKLNYFRVQASSLFSKGHRHWKEFFRSSNHLLLLGIINFPFKQYII